MFELLPYRQLLSVKCDRDSNITLLIPRKSVGSGSSVTVMLAIVSGGIIPAHSAWLRGEITFLLALRLAAGICRVTLYSVFLSSSSAMKLASCTNRLAFTICSRSFRKLRVSTASLQPSILTELEKKKKHEHGLLLLHSHLTEVTDVKSSS